MQSYITAIGTATPRYKVDQEGVLDFMTRAHGLDKQQAHELAVLYRATGIQSRFSVLEDYAKATDFSFYPNDTVSPQPSTQARLQVYSDEAVTLSLAAVRDCLESHSITNDQITHLITVSCTGLYAPGLDVALTYRLGLSSTVERTAINFMGCYAAFNALKVADAICKAGEANVLIVCTELCSLHFQNNPSEDNLLANALFGDGSAAVLVQTYSNNGLKLKPQTFKCDLLPSGERDMAWNIGETGFEMKLSTYVPEVINSGVDTLLERLGYQRGQFKHFAIHPGGKKILRVIEKKLGLEPQDNWYAHEVLRKYGNMSSPTILFVLKEIFKMMTEENDQERILAMAFGPGLTLESMVLEVVAHG